MANRAALIGLALAFLPATGASADDAFTLDCRVTETEKIDTGSPTTRSHTLIVSVDLSARKFFVFEDSSRKYSSGRVESLRALDAGSAQLTAANEFRHGTEHVKGTGLRLDLGTLALAETSVLVDGRTRIETALRGTCEKAPYRPLPAR
jgi:hypothetical protein